MRPPAPPEPRSRPLASGILALLLMVACVGLVIWRDGAPELTATTAELAVIAAISDVLIVAFAPAITFTATDVIVITAVVFLGPSSALVVGGGAVALGFLGVRTVRIAGRTDQVYAGVAALINAAAFIIPASIAGGLFVTLNLDEQATTPFALGVFVVAALAAALNGLIIALLLGVRTGESPRAHLRAMLDGSFGTLLVQILLVVVAALAYRELQTAGLIMAAGVAVALGYMARLLVLARDESDRNRAMSWGMLSALVYTLDARDPASARHCAAVAMFSRDVARKLGLTEAEQELAHTAGLLHDIGKFALSDRILTGLPLEDQDWTKIREHPAIGARLLRSISRYGPIAEIVAAHHERIDGRGYPNELAGDDIPLLARIVAACEVYDTMTAPDAYRPAVSSFEAMNELHRVAGSQLDADVVNAIAELLAGRGTDYRHATAADFDRELDRKRELAGIIS